MYENAFEDKIHKTFYFIFISFQLKEVEIKIENGLNYSIKPPFVLLLMYQVDRPLVLQLIFVVQLHIVFDIDLFEY
jgi:hypothetical protein